MLLRFVVAALDKDSGRRQGVFQAAAELRDSERVADHERAKLRELADWFNLNLERPAKFAVSRRPHAKAQAISWFKSDAKAHLDRMWEVVELLSRHNVTVDIIRTERPGYIVYEDEHQVTAYPFSDTPT